MYRIMLVDDEENILKALRRLLTITPCVYDGIEYKIRVESFPAPMKPLSLRATMQSIWFCPTIACRARMAWPS